MKKRFAAVLLAILLLVCTLPQNNAAAASSDLAYVRVLLSTEGAKTIKMTVSGTYTLVESNRIFTDGTLTVSGSGNTVTVTHSAEGRLYSGKTVTIERANLSRYAGSLRFSTKYGTRFYLGHFTVTAADGVLSVVNRVPMTHYLYGVVGHEMADSWPIEALKAQAICAKCYAFLNLRPSRSYDIGDTSADQVYKGYTAANVNVITAVDETRDAVLTANGNIMRCYYAASNGGYMLRPSSNWSGPVEAYDWAYSEGPDAYDLKNPMTPRETVLIPAAFHKKSVPEALYNLFTQKLAEAAAVPGAIPAGYTMSSLLRIDSVRSMKDDGSTEGLAHTVAVVQATVIATINEIPATPTPTATPESTAAPTAESTPEATPETTPEADAEASPDASADPAAEATAEATTEPTAVPTPVPTPAGPALTLEVPLTFSFRLEELTALGLFSNTSLRLLYVEPVTDGFAVLHARYGHGVGMSQRGAQQMANEGKTCAEILAYYYSGGTLSTMDILSPESPEAAPAEPTVPDVEATGRVVREDVNLRKGSSSTTESLGRVPTGTALKLYGLFGDWYQVVVPSTGQFGYIFKEYVETASAGVIAFGQINSTAVNYRSGPGTDYTVLGQLSKTTRVGLIGVSGDWYKLRILATGAEGYVTKRYVTVTQKSVPTPVPGQTGTAATATPAADATPTPTNAPTPTPVPTPTPSPTPTPAPVGPYTTEGSINGSGVNLRKGASTGTSSLGKLSRGTRLGVYRKVGSWYQVRVLDSGSEGYVYAKYVTLAAASGSSEIASAGYINASSVNFRTGASTRYRSLGRLKRGTKITVLGSSGSWLRLRVNETGREGYVFGRYVTLTANGASGSAQQGIIATYLNLRTAPSVDATSRVLLTMDKGAVVTVHSSAGGWCYVTFNGTTGYCLASCVQMG